MSRRLPILRISMDAEKHEARPALQGRRLQLACWMLPVLTVGVVVLALTTLKYSAVLMPSARAAAVPGSSHWGQTGQLSAGPWGRVTWYRLTIAPPIEAIPVDDYISVQTRWYLPGYTHKQIADFLASLDLSEAQFNSLLQSTHQNNGQFIIQPDPQLVHDLSAEARRQIYIRLAQHDQNRTQLNAFRYWGHSTEEWLQSANLSPEVQARIKPWIYQNGHFLFLAEETSTLEDFTDPQERAELLQTLASESTLVLKLHVPHNADVTDLVSYWGVGKHAIAWDTLLKSLAQSEDGGEIDIVHLLPPFARQRLYTYPHTVSSSDMQPSRDCHWTALNFFNTVPDDRYTDVKEVANAYHQDFQTVQTPRYGDLVLLQEGDEIFHAAVYIADNVVFTKNGPRFSRPWMLLPLEVMLDFYPRLGPVKVRFLRRVEQADPPVPPEKVPL